MRKKLKEEHKKSKVSISIDPDLLELWDEYISGKQLNRSKSMEQLLEKYLNDPESLKHLEKLNIKK
jgi:metal-responsive CopG/Arc/MetJ family transcriptional regulator